jgi:hypothetical protein
MSSEVPISQERLQEVSTRFYDWLVGLLDELDPMELLCEDNPGREYEPEARIIVPLVSSAVSADDLAFSIQGVFARFFSTDLAGGVERYLPIAEAAMQKWRELQRSDTGQ